MKSFLDKFIRWLRLAKIVGLIPENSIVCDIGCGKDGYLLKKISGLIKYSIGFDKEVQERREGEESKLSSSPLAVAREAKYELKKLKIAKGIPLKTESCDAITMLAVLEHLASPQEILSECRRILKNNGRLILTAPTPFSRPILEILAFKLKLIDSSEIEDHKNYFWPGQIKKMLIQAGFKEEKISSYFFEIFLNNLIVAEK